MKYTITCSLEKESQADKIIRSLKNTGVKNTEISILMPDHKTVRDVAIAEVKPQDASKPTPVVNSALGWLSSIGKVEVAGVGPFVAAGPIQTFLTGPTVNGKPENFLSSLVSVGVPEADAKQLDIKLKANNTIFMSVQTDVEAIADSTEKTFGNESAKDVKRTVLEAAKR